MGGRRQRAFANRPSHTSIAHAISSPPSYPNPPAIPAPPFVIPAQAGTHATSALGARLNTPTARPSRLCAAAGGSEPKTRVAYRVGSCLRRNDEKGRRNDGGAGQGAARSRRARPVACARDSHPPPNLPPGRGGGMNWGRGGRVVVGVGWAAGAARCPRRARRSCAQPSGKRLALERLG